jgi:DinB superfamily
MSAQNPYDKFLDGRPLEVILAATPNKIAEYLEVIAPHQQKQPAPGKWSAAEIVCHLADCEIVFAFRLRQTLAEDNPTIQPFDQDHWARIYPGVPAAIALESFSGLRKWNLRVIHGALPAAAGRKLTHPERGAITFLTIVETMAGHDLNHLEQLHRLAGATSSS